MTTTIMPSVYRIDVDKLRGTIKNEADETSTSEIIPAIRLHEVIKSEHEARKERIESKAQSYSVIAQEQVGQYSVAIYKAASGNKEHKWTHLFEQEIPGLEVKYPNLAAFFAVGDDLYAISSGMGYTLFEQFIDTSFALDVARHIMKPSLSATTERDIAGAVYGRNQQFRTSQLVISSQNLGTVWQAIKGEITDEFKSRRDFASIYVVGRGKITVSAGSSLTIHKSLDIKKLVDLLDLLNKVLEEELTEEQKEAFEFLDGLTLINPRREAQKIETIKISMGEQLFEDLVNENDIDFDFSHKNFTAYQSASSYSVDCEEGVDPWEEPPTATEVLSSIKDSELISASNGSELIAELSNISFIAEHDEPNQGNVRGSVLDHLHGEVTNGSTNYFVIDGKFYSANTSFIDRVSSDFEKLLSSNKFMPETDFSLDHYTSHFSSEGEYNDSYQHKTNWIEGDRVFWDNVEIADLIHWNEHKLYIVHNKLGFGVSVRDVCSQVLHSMAIINRMRVTANREEIGEYYDRIIAKHYSGRTAPISRDDFIDKLLRTDSNNVIFVIGYVRANAVDTSTRSNIAKFEAVKLCENDSRVYDFPLKVLHIPKV